MVSGIPRETKTQKLAQKLAAPLEAREAILFLPTEKRMTTYPDLEQFRFLCKDDESFAQLSAALAEREAALFALSEQSKFSKQIHTKNNTKGKSQKPINPKKTNKQTQQSEQSSGDLSALSPFQSSASANAAFINTVVGASEKDENPIQNAFQGWLAQVIDSLLPDTIYLYMPKSRRYIYVNQAITRYGYTPEQILGGAVDMTVEHIHPDDRAQVLELHKERLRLANEQTAQNDGAEPFFEAQCRMRCADGSYRWVQDCRYVMEREASGEVKTILGYLHDIHSLKEAQERLEYHSELEKTTASVSRMFAKTPIAGIDRAIVETLRQIGTQTRADHAYIYLSPEPSLQKALKTQERVEVMRDAYTWAAPSVPPIQIREITPATLRWAFDRLEQLRSLQIARLDSLPEEAVEMRQMLEASGTKSLLVVPLHIEGRVIGLLGVSSVNLERVWAKEEVRMLRLIAETIVHAFERKFAEQALRESEARFRTIFNCAPLAISILTPKGEVLVCNKQLERFLGYTEDDVRGRNFLDFVRPEDRDRSAELFYELLTGSIDSYTLELQYLHKSGAPIWTNVTTSLVRDANGKPTFVIRMLENIAERKAALANMQHYTTLVSEQKEVLERQSDILLKLNGELLQKQRELEELNKSKDKFFSIISHDLRSPFSSLLGISRLLAESATDLERDEIKELAGALHSQALNVFDFMENLLKWAQAHTGRMKFEPTVLPLREITAPVEALLRENAAAKSITLRNECPEEITVFADENMMRSVVQNLVSNALKFTPVGGSVVISARQSLKKSSLVEISVRDSGIGMSREDAAKLFRIDVVHTTKGTADETGTGLGLILCKELVEKNGGTIWVESEEGSGTTFTFTLPLAKSL
jgi:PAS domain S-box-containing protein